MNDERDKQMEARLDKLLRGLPDASVSSNFTARVMQAIECDAAKEFSARQWRWNWHWLLPRAAIAAVVIGVSVISYHNSTLAKRIALVHSVAAVSEVQSLPGPEILKDYEAIRLLNSAPQADEEVLALMQ